MTKEEALSCLRGISNIEGYFIKNNEINNLLISEHLEYITKILQDEILNNNK